MDFDYDLFGPSGAAITAGPDQCDIIRKPGVSAEGSALILSATDSDVVAQGSRNQTDGRNFFRRAGLLLSDAEQREQFLDNRLEAQDHERLEMCRELHDSTGQLLLALRLSIARLMTLYGTGDKAPLFDEITGTVRQIDQEIRAFSYLHYPAELGKAGLAGALQSLVRGLRERTGLGISFHSNCDQSVANGPAAAAMLRIAQEALMNVHRHAHATSVRVSLISHDGRLELSVQDDGQGMPPVNSEAMTDGVGLQGMRHRIERLGGQFLIRRIKHGTKIVARLAVD